MQAGNRSETGVPASTRELTYFGKLRRIRSLESSALLLKFSMRAVAVIGIGKTPFGAFPDRDIRSLAVEAVQNSLADSSVDARQIEAFYLGNFAGPSFVGQNHLAPYVGLASGLAPGVAVYSHRGRLRIEWIRLFSCRPERGRRPVRSGACSGCRKDDLADRLPR